MTVTPELILHIGHYKTGTTALQVFFDTNRDLLRQQGLHYASTPLLQGKHSALAFALLREAGVTQLMHGFRGRRGAADHWASLFDAVRALPSGEAMLVSSEEFIRLGAHSGAAEALRVLIAGAGDIRFRVIAYLRAPQDHLQSWYNQLVKMGAAKDGLDATIRTAMEPIHWDYAQALRPWIEIFGPEAIVLRHFDDRLRQGDALFADFLGALGRHLPTNAQLPPGDPNPRLDDRLLAFRRALTRTRVPRRQVEEQIAGLILALADEDGDDAAATDFDTIRRRARDGITILAGLPGSGIDPAAMTAALPEPQAAAGRDLATVVTLLADELARMRAQQRRLQARIRALETPRDDQHPDPEDPQA